MGFHLSESLERVYSNVSEFIKKEIQGSQLPIVKRRNIEYYNIPTSFDIETSSWIKDGVKFANMYIWQFGFNGSVVYGRTWEEYENLVELLEIFLSLGEKRKLIIYVHNLSYEFQFIRNRFKFIDVFTHKKRRPVYARTETMEYRCSYFLSNYALAYIGENLLHKYKVKKMVGDLDYSLVRGSRTPLEEKELIYAFNDVRVVMAYIQEKIEEEGSILNIPLTNTGYVRRYTRDKCFFGFSEDPEERRKTFFEYKSIINATKIEGSAQYKQLKRCFMGGFTHANIIYSNRTIKKDMGHVDFKSSYPKEIILEKYPMGAPVYYPELELDELKDLMKKGWVCFFDIAFKEIQASVNYENILSLHKCNTHGRIVTNNGRVVYAEELETSMSSIFFEDVEYFYEWDGYKILNVYAYQTAPLPRNLILSVLEFFSRKTSLKGIPEKEREYMVSKNMLNSIFGMMVMDICRDEISYDDGWDIKTLRELGDDFIENELKDYNKNYNRFICYQWGVLITDYARRDLFTLIKELGDDYVYSDTDSCFYLNPERHEEFFLQYNNNIIKKTKNVAKKLDIPYEMFSPKNKKGQTQIMGTIDFETPLKMFKTFGAKRYMYMENNGFVNMVLSGCKKQFAMPYLIAKNNEISLQSQEFEKIKDVYLGKESRKWLLEQEYNYAGVFDEFGPNMYIPPDFSGKLTQTYIDEPSQGLFLDYLGNVNYFSEKTSLNMTPQPFSCSITKEYEKLLKGEYDESY